MKIKRSQIMIGIMISLVLLLGTSDILFSKSTEASDLEEFLIRLETTDKGIRLTGHQGCAFKELNFTLKDSVKKTVDQYGRVSFVRFSTKGIEKEGLADFLFKVMKTEDGLCIEGVSGTEWEELSVTLPVGADHYFIDKKGIADYRQSGTKMD